MWFNCVRQQFSAKLSISAAVEQDSGDISLARLVGIYMGKFNRKLVHIARLLSR